MLSLILACDINYGIAKNGKIPWYSSTDLKLFQTITTGKGNNLVIMGRKTFESLKNPLSNRINFVLSKSLKSTKVETFNNLNDALEEAKNRNVDDIFIIGGEKVYKEVMVSYPDQIKLIHISVFNKNHHCDQFFYKFNEYSLIDFVNYDDFTYFKYAPKNFEELEYLKLVSKILIEGESKMDRTKVGTKSIFGAKLEFNLEEGFPLLTTKFTPLKTIIKELLWFLKGDTNSKNLEAQGCNIWKGNSTREFLDSRNLNYEEGDIGALYGFQWRHFGEDYQGFNKEGYLGFDQIKEVVNLIKNDPSSRRILISAWNPDQFDKMSIYPCHVLAQFNVRNSEYLDCQLYQRSCDMMLGIPFNIASYSLLTMMLAQVCGLKAGKFYHILGDAHVYNNHTLGAIEQIKRSPYRFPNLELNKNVKDIFDFKLEDFTLKDYLYHPSIKFEMAV